VTHRTSSLFRQRLPFLHLLIFAITGILLGRFAPVPSSVWLGLAAVSAVLFLSRRTGLFLLGISVFACLQIWQSRDSPAAQLARWIGTRALPVEAEGAVASEPRIFESGAASFDLRLTRLTVAGATFAPRVTVLADWPGPAPSYGDAVRLTATLQNIAPPRNPGQFPFAEWSALRQVYSRLEARDPRDGAVVSHGHGQALQSAALAARDWMRGVMVRGLHDPAVADLIVAMVLGDTSSLPERVQEQFRGTGTYHLFSVSGLHVGMLAVLLWYFLRILGLPRRQAAFVIIPALFFYAFMTGWKPSSVRAAIMTSVVLFGLVANRRPVLFNNLCAAAFLILLGDTNQLFNAGFQLSFCVVGAIFLGARPLGTWLEKPFRPDPFFPEKLLHPAQRTFFSAGRAVAGLAAVSAAAWTGSLPLTLGYFHLVSFSALPANLLAVPISFGIMAVAMLSLLTAPISVWVSEVFNQANWLLTHLLLKTVGLFAALPGSFVYLGSPLAPAPLAEVVVFDFGPGGAAWLSAGGRGWLLDCGPLFHHDGTLLPFLRAQGRRTLDGLLLTHGDAAHIGAAPELFVACPPRQVVDSMQNDLSSHRQRFQTLLAEQNFPKSLCRAGDTLTIARGVRLHILHPPTLNSRAVADDKVVVTRLDVAGVRVLFQSDASFATEQWLLQNASNELRCDILIKGRPHSGPSGDGAFLDAAQPRVVIASAADFPRSERIPPEFAASLAARGIRLFRQDETGAVTIRIFSTHWEISAFLGGREYIRLQ
jgi:competence protein ComEC